MRKIFVKPHLRKKTPKVMKKTSDKIPINKKDISAMVDELERETNQGTPKREEI